MRVCRNHRTKGISDAVFTTLIHSKLCAFVFIPDSRINSSSKRLDICASGINYIVLYNPGCSQLQHHIWRGYSVHSSCFRVYKVGVWNPNFLHYTANKRDCLIQTMIESLIDPLLPKKYVDCVILGKKSTKKINWIIRSNKACRWVRRKKSSLTNRPRLIYHYSNMAPKLSGIEEQKNFKKVAILT